MISKTKCRYSREALEKFRVVVLKSINKTQNLLSNLMIVLDGKTSNEPGSQIKMYEDANEVSEQESVSKSAQRQGALLAKLERALDRINDGTYGVCIKTGELISEERLMLVPHTEYSVEGKIPVKPVYFEDAKDKNRDVC